MTLKAAGWRTGWIGSASAAGSFWITSGTVAAPTLLQPEDSISALSLDQIYTALSASPASERDVLLVLLSRGGIIEPAYQISKLYKAYAREQFVVAVPERQSRLPP